MAKPETIAKMLPVFHEVFDDETLVIVPAMSARDVEGWDSLSHIRLMVAMESAFDVRIKASEAAKLNDVGELADLIERKLGTHRGRDSGDVS
jgi:acyl carrier protein